MAPALSVLELDVVDSKSIGPWAIIGAMVCFFFLYNDDTGGGMLRKGVTSKDLVHEYYYGVEREGV